jgi:hypothetical protein
MEQLCSAFFVLCFVQTQSAINTCTHSRSLEFYILTWQFFNKIHRQSCVEHFKMPNFQQCEHKTKFIAYKTSISA